MLLILTNSEDATVSYLAPILKRSGIPFIRLDTDKLVSQIEIAYRPEKAEFKFDGVWIDAAVVSNIWYRRPESLKGECFADTPEGKYTLSEWAEAIEGFLAHVPKSRWINHPACNALASHKPEQLTTALSVGFKIPDTIITQDQAVLRDFFNRHQDRVIVKPMANGYIERATEEPDSLIYTNQVFPHHLDNLTDLSVCPTLFQQFIKKQYDVRITVLDGDIHAVALLANDSEGMQRCDIRRNNMADVSYKSINLPEKIKKSINALMRLYSLRFAAIDMAVSDAGEWYYFEVNPNGQWAWLDMQANQSIAASFVKCFSCTKVKDN